MSFAIVVRLLGFFALILAGFMILPAAIGLALGETAVAMAFVPSIGAGLAFFLIQLLLRSLLRKELTKKPVLSVRGGFLFVTLSWILASLLGCLPFLFSQAIPSFPQAFFETMSGFTTTGASILTDVESLPRSLLFWRSLTHWLGGMGIVVLTVALFPLLGVGGFHLIRAEAPGPSVDRITPRITETAKLLWIIYLVFTLVQTILLMIGGMDLIDALTHTFGTLATGGFSTKNLSVGAYSSGYIQWVITVFMVLAGINFTLFHRMFTGSFDSLGNNSEFKAYLAIFFLAAGVVSIDLLQSGTYLAAGEAARHGSFQVASILTTTGFATADFDAWPAVSKSVLFALMFVGGSAGSTAGGVKVLRLIVLLKLAGLHLKRLVEPRGIFTLRVNKRPLQEDSIEAIAGFVFLYVGILLMLCVAVAIAGYDLETSFSTALAVLGNIGPGFGGVGPMANYAHFPDWLIGILSMGMMLGRLELYTVLAIFTPLFWKR